MQTTLTAALTLKAAAESTRDQAGYSRIETALTALLAPLAKDEAIALARELKIVRRCTTRQQALAAITRKVFEERLAIESIAV